MESTLGTGASARRWLMGLGLGTLALVTLMPPRDLRASASFATSSHVPIEQRMAIALSPERTTLWSQLRVSAPAGELALVVPAADGASVDLSNDAWFEALEVATAPRVLPPTDPDTSCPGIDLSEVVDEIGQLGHFPTAAVSEVVVHDDADGVALWALSHGMQVSTASFEAMAGMAPMRFVTLRFTHAGGDMLTPTVRVTTPASGSPVAFPTVLSAATSDDLAVTLWTLAPGRSSLVGSDEGTIDAADLTIDAATGTSNYAALRHDLLSADESVAMIESSSHASLDQKLAAGDGAVIDPVIESYYERAALYAGMSDVAACIADANATLNATQPLSLACPAASLGHVDQPTPCDETVEVGEIDATTLRCFAGADDLAVGLSGLVPSQVVLTRISMLIVAGMQGESFDVEVGAVEDVLPAWRATDVDDSGCAEGGGDPGTGTGPGSSGSSGGGRTRRVPVYQVHDGCDGRYVGEVLYYVAETADTAPAAYYVEDDCGGSPDASYDPSIDVDVDVDVEVDAAAPSSDDCGGDSPEYGGDDCGGDSPEYGGDDCGGDASSGDDCGGDASGADSCSGDSGGGDCAGDSASGADCGGDAMGGADCGGDCSLGGRRKKRMPRFSILVMIALAFVLPLRRMARPRG